MELKDFLRTFRTSWILITVCTLLGIAGGAALSFITTPQYVASTRLYVSVRTAASGGTTELAQGTTFARQAVTSYVEVVNSAVVLDDVIDELNLNLTAAQLALTIDASSPLDTVLIDIKVTNEDPVLAAEIANSVGKNFGRIVVDQLEKLDGEEASPVKIETIQPALVPRLPTSPKVPLNLAIGLVVGLAIGCGIAILRSVLDTRIRGLRDIEVVTDAPMLGAITFDPEVKKRPLVVHADPKNALAESFRTLRTNLQFVSVEGGPRSFVVTSSIPAEGKSTTVANLAIALAETGARVALVDGDLRKSRLAHYMEIEGGVGLTDVLIGRAKLADVLQKWGTGELFVLPSGRVPPNPSEILGSAAMVRLLATLTEQFDIVLVDATPLLLVTDAAVLSKLCGGALMVVASGRTTRTELAAAVRALERVDSHLVGVIITMLPGKGQGTYGYGSYTYGTRHGDSDPLPVEAIQDHRGGHKTHRRLHKMNRRRG
ncbi:polysaccharide biosynthesis tyrosine autokinase [Cryobacterium suzukii]|uniref:non-specific protein-tyrosine kinase n=1 Tax=Cryobacterium suzukii TaxID=1259198 RepID=A0A4R9AK90_9MICO|nr:polysaccharide biosynthesis tyrosine autokinase [Cryobacterium suzukii]TFD63149.1 polysaccharide biosynthesis tyrosine autokinase [Cryobacterium suzukii]